MWEGEEAFFLKKAITCSLVRESPIAAAVEVAVVPPAVDTVVVATAAAAAAAGFVVYGG